MKKLNILLAALTLAFPTIVSAKTYDDVQTKYYRSSIYSILINHTEQKFSDEIRSQFINIPVPDQYYDHNLNVRVINVNKKSKNYQDSIADFIDNNMIASRMVGKWFDRNILDGQCSIDLVKNRSIYNASEVDRELAQRSARGMAMLADMGDELIGRTFLLVNEIRYIDKSKASGAAGTGLKVLGVVAGIALGNSDISNLANNTGDMISSIKGFKVKIITHLYQLNWDDETAGMFYQEHYSDTPDQAKHQAFENDRRKYKLTYVGKVESGGSTTSFMGINEDQPLMMVRKACQRALDDNVADLQKKYDQFRVKSPIVEIENNRIYSPIGLKEGITAKSRYEVLEAQEKDGRTVYKRIAVVRPVDTRIWDNRFMATEEKAYGADFGATAFIKVSGGEILPGHLLRQLD
ncbi:MAG: hypothetical protein HDT00_01220 [Bacteroidales bacterium]|nr:hypothetical protein [Bacteroidales bacterium]